MSCTKRFADTQQEITTGDVVDRSPAAGHAEALDKKILDQLREIMGDDYQETLRELIELYLGESPGLLKNLHAAVDEGDATALQRAAHSLKSSSANVGATTISATFGEIEAACRTGRIDASLVSRAAIEFEDVKLALEDLRDGL